MSIARAPEIAGSAGDPVAAQSALATKPRTATRVLVGILALAALLRMLALAYDLPFIYHPDEPFNVNIAQRMFRTGDLDPHFFVYPSLSYYVNAAAYVPYYLGGRLAGVFHARADILPLVELAMGTTRAPLPGAIILGRSVSLAFGVATAGLTFLLGRRLFGSTTIGALGALLVAVAPPCVDLSRLITPDAIVVFFVVASVFMATLILQEGKRWQYVLGGIAVGLAASAKYNAALVILPVIAAHFLRAGRRGWRMPVLYLALLSSAAGFVAGTPFAVLDFPTFIGFVIVDGQHYARGHPGMEGDTLRWYLTYMATTAAIAYALGTLEIVRGSIARSREILLLAVFPVAYFAFIAGFEVRNDRTLHPLTPFMFLLAASFLGHAWQRARASAHRLRRGTSMAAVAGVALAALMQPALDTLAETRTLLSPNSRESARLWIAKSLPRGSRIAVESYSPFVEPSQYRVEGIPTMIAHEPGWYEATGFDYLVFSEGMYGRFFHEPKRYPSEAARYDALCRRFGPPLKVFADGGFDIRIYEVRHSASGGATAAPNDAAVEGCRGGLTRGPSGSCERGP